MLVLWCWFCGYVLRGSAVAEEYSADHKPQTATHRAPESQNHWLCGLCCRDALMSCGLCFLGPVVLWSCCYAVLWFLRFCGLWFAGCGFRGMWLCGVWLCGSALFYFRGAVVLWFVLCNTRSVTCGLWLPQTTNHRPHGTWSVVCGL